MYSITNGIGWEGKGLPGIVKKLGTSQVKDSVEGSLRCLGNATFSYGSRIHEISGILTEGFCCVVSESWLMKISGMARVTG
jgi:hypothetical protein